MEKVSVLNVDDGGSFNKFVQETERLLGTTDSPDEVNNLVQFRVLEAFVNRLPKDFTGEEPLKKKSGGQKSKSKNTRNTPDEIYDARFHGKMSKTLKKRIEEERGSDMKLVIVKKMYKTDLSEHHDRLSIPVKQIKDTSFLTREEKRAIDNERELHVMLMEPCGKNCSMVLVKWQLTTTDSLALRTSWNDVLERNHHGKDKHFKLNDVIQLWSFRVDGELWLAIDKIWDAPLEEIELETGKTKVGKKRKREKSNEEELPYKRYGNNICTTNGELNNHEV